MPPVHYGGGMVNRVDPEPRRFIREDKLEARVGARIADRCALLLWPSWAHLAAKWGWTDRRCNPTAYALVFSLQRFAEFTMAQSGRRWAHGRGRGSSPAAWDRDPTLVRRRGPGDERGGDDADEKRAIVKVRFRLAIPRANLFRALLSL